MSAPASLGLLTEIPSNTHFVALCGVPSATASPKKDGWFLSDFYLFNQVFAGLGASRTWVTCVHPRDLVDQYKELCHGNPYQERRIVLDTDTRPSNVVVEPETRLLENFLWTFENVCHKASDAKEPVLLLLFGHGDHDTHGVQVGLFPGSSDQENTPLLHIDKINAIMAKCPGLQLSILITSCFSGTWTIDTNTTAMTGAGEENESLSWPQSKSLKRACGSIFASAIVQLLVEEDERSGHSQGQLPPKDYREFITDIRTKLLRLDRFEDEHKEMFSAQDQKWTMEHHERTAIPMSAYLARIQKLKMVEPTDKTKHPYGDRTSDEQLKEWGQKSEDQTPVSRSWLTSMAGRTGGSVRAVERAVLAKARQYEASNPESANQANNIWVHNLIAMCRDGTATVVELQELSSILLYRENAGLLAEKIRDMMEVGPFPRFHLWDFQRDFVAKYKDKRDNWEKTYFRLICNGKLIPKPLPDEGHEWLKPQRYLAAACFEKSLGPDDIKLKMEKVGQVLLSTQTLMKNEIEADYRGRKIGTWYKTIHESVRRVLKSRSRSRSPSKRLGQRSSLGDSFSGLSLGSPGRK